MKTIGAVLIFILCIISVCLCIKLMIDTAMPEYTVLYKMDNGKKITLGVRNNITNEVIDVTPENLKLAKGDITYVSPRCYVYNRRLMCY